MASISAFGIGCAARTAASVASRAAAATIPFALVGASPAGKVDVALTGLRSTAGKVQACLTLRADLFPDCKADPAARRLTVPAGQALSFADLPSGAYALALIHDENGNGRLDTRFGIPTEGFGFSRNPAILFGPPRFAAARFAVAGGENDQTVKVRYLF